MLSLMPIVYFVFAVLVVGGGAVGTVKSHSWHSVVASLAFGAVAVVSGMMTRKNPGSGLTLGLIDALALVAFFIFRFTQTGKMALSAGPIGLGIVVVILSAVALSSLNRSKR